MVQLLNDFYNIHTLYILKVVSFFVICDIYMLFNWCVAFIVMICGGENHHVSLLVLK